MVYTSRVEGLSPLDTMGLEASALTEHILICGNHSQVMDSIATHILDRDSRAEIHYLGETALTHDRLHLLDGDAARMDLGLSGSAYAQLLRKITIIHHIGCQPAVNDKQAERDVHAAEHVLRFAAESEKTNRVTFWSPLLIASKGRLTENPKKRALNAGVAELAAMKVEAIANAGMKSLPLTILRPPYLVGTGSLAGCSAPEYKLLRALAHDAHAIPTALLRNVSIHAVPLDFAAALAHQLTYLPFATGRTFHLTDPHPPSLAVLQQMRAQPDGAAKVALGSIRALFTRNRTIRCDNMLTALGSMSMRFPPLEHFADELLSEAKA